MLNAKSFLLRDIQGVEKSGLSPPGDWRNHGLVCCSKDQGLRPGGNMEWRRLVGV